PRIGPVDVAVRDAEHAESDSAAVSSRPRARFVCIRAPSLESHAVAGRELAGSCLHALLEREAAPAADQEIVTLGRGDGEQVHASALVHDHTEVAGRSRTEEHSIGVAQTAQLAAAAGHDVEARLWKRVARDDL